MVPLLRKQTRIRLCCLIQQTERHFKIHAITIHIAINSFVNNQKVILNDIKLPICDKQSDQDVSQEARV